MLAFAGSVTLATEARSFGSRIVTILLNQSDREKKSKPDLGHLMQAWNSTLNNFHCRAQQAVQMGHMQAACEKKT